MNRKFYANAWLPVGPLEVGAKTQQFWNKALDTFGECDITDRGGADDTPFIYALQRGISALPRPTTIPTPPIPQRSPGRRASACTAWRAW